MINCIDVQQARQVRASLLDRGVGDERLFIAVAPSDDTWARDHGPITVYESGQPRLLDFRFNGWGNKYPAGLDDALSHAMSDAGRFGDCVFERVELVLEGGSIESDGAGTLLTTRDCLLHPQRNPALSQADIEVELKRLLGCEHVLWLRSGCIAGDDTDGHIDMLARFVSPRTLVYQGCDETGYSCYASLKAMEKELQDLRDPDGQAYELIPLPWPAAHFDPAGRRLPASYANFLVINTAVLLPVYNDPADVAAIDVLKKCFPDRDIVPIDCSAIIQQSGSLHCLTMQVPAGVPVTQLEC